MRDVEKKAVKTNLCIALILETVDYEKDVQTCKQIVYSPIFLTIQQNVYYGVLLLLSSSARRSTTNFIRPFVSENDKISRIYVNASFSANVKLPFLRPAMSIGEI